MIIRECAGISGLKLYYPSTKDECEEAGEFEQVLLIIQRSNQLHIDCMVKAFGRARHSGNASSGLRLRSPESGFSRHLAPP